jgi:hypothetical protein
VGWGYGARVITERQAYDAMYLFLVEFWKRDALEAPECLPTALGRARGCRLGAPTAARRLRPARGRGELAGEHAARKNLPV